MSLQLIILQSLSTPGLDRSGKPPSSGLHLTTCHSDAPMHVGPVGGPSRLVGVLGVVRAELRVLSLGGGRYLSTFGHLVGILAKFKRIIKGK